MHLTAALVDAKVTQVLEKKDCDKSQLEEKFMSDSDQMMKLWKKKTQVKVVLSKTGEIYLIYIGPKKVDTIVETNEIVASSEEEESKAS